MPANHSVHLVIHAGLPKAGSTAFQEWCISSTSTLSRYGIHYPGFKSENGSFLVEYLANPSPARLNKILDQLDIAAKECQARGLHSILLSSEQIFEFASTLKELEAGILGRLEIIQSLSYLVIRREIKELAASSWKQSILAAGERRPLEEYSDWLNHCWSVRLQALAELNLIEYAYVKPLNYIDILSLILAKARHELPIPKSQDQSLASTQEPGHVFSNQTLSLFCYRFWLSKNRAYGPRANIISTIRLQKLESRPNLREYLTNNKYSGKTQKLLEAIENSAINEFFRQSSVGRAANLVSQFLSYLSNEEQQLAMEFLMINEDYLYEPMFGKSHADLIVAMIRSGTADRTLRFRDIL